jgi:ParB family chromosome partitioning protein
LLDGTGWLPEPLRTAGRDFVTTQSADSNDAEVEAEASPAVVAEEDGTDDVPADPGEAEQDALAAE